MAVRAKINIAWLTPTEAREYSKRVELRKTVAQVGSLHLPGPARAHLRVVAWRYIGGGAALTAVAAGTASAVSDKPDEAALVVAMFTAFMVLVGGLFAHQGHVHHAYTTWIAEYLDEIGYHSRTGQPPTRKQARSTSDYDPDPLGRTYPVTGGAYDPDLYARRGGYATYERMDALGIDDYDTYKNNVLEAE